MLEFETARSSSLRELVEPQPGSSTAHKQSKARSKAVPRRQICDVALDEPDSQFQILGPGAWRCKFKRTSQTSHTIPVNQPCLAGGPVILQLCNKTALHASPFPNIQFPDEAMSRSVSAPAPFSLHALAAGLEPWINLTRVSRFAGTMLVFWPYAWGLTMTARSANVPLPRFFYLLLCGFIGASLSHSAGCVWNDILDRNFDRQVERTKGRPIASGKISVPGAVAFLWAHLGIMIYMVRDVNDLAWKIALVTMFPLAGLYPLMKRITYWPQAWLGISMNAGVVMAWAFITGSIPPSAFALLGGTWAWTIFYDTLYACQDKKDDVKAGVKSTALLFGNAIKLVLACFASLMMAGLLLAGILNNHHYPYFVLSVGGGSVYLATELYRVDTDSPKSCWGAFHRNGFNLGALIWAGFLADYVWAAQGAALVDFAGKLMLQDIRLSALTHL
ncbi:UbiA prenyltransferase family-domain-containing protein [Mycena maculata]|uniref:4-hydroxybenzoate polyprenyltransferase, mitochondrial n=1 Tax=Mycena maculata TaxID=230809 RepID=A0AAD7K8L9_9AGAR|nr:UbiA prenyltransferase family-domain-containing protein [Mycena maculata]